METARSKMLTRRSILGIPGLLLAQENDSRYPMLQPWKANVKLTVSSRDDIKPLIVSYISRELRSLSGVTISDSEQDYEIRIVAMYLETNGTR